MDLYNNNLKLRHRIKREESLLERYKKYSNCSKKYVINRSILEYKNFTQDFPKEIIIYKTHVEIVFNMGFNFIKINEYIIKSNRK